jgi:RNA polymerase sigma factor (sigma-70 family)
VLDASRQQLLRELTPLVLGVLVRRYRDFAGCEDAVQEALVAAARQWPERGLPDNPRAWLIKVATRRLTDQIRADTARRLREELVVSFIPPDEQIATVVGANERDDTLDLYFMCCHPRLSPASQVALTLRAVGGLTTLEIARAFFVPEATMAQRLSRAKQTIRDAGLAEPTPAEQLGRLGSVLQVLYLVFNEGYTASAGDQLLRVDLSSEAIRVTRLLERLLPDELDVKALLALMLLTDARRAARTGVHGELIPLDEQDRSRWDRAMIDEGTRIVDDAFAAGARSTNPFQAAIAALHDEAASTETTDWAQIAMLYAAMLQQADNPMVRLSHAIARGMSEGPATGLAALDELAGDPRLAGHYRLDAARAHLLERSGDPNAAIAFFRRAAQGTTSTAERDYLMLHAARLAERPGRS